MPALVMRHCRSCACRLLAGCEQFSFCKHIHNYLLSSCQRSTLWCPRYVCARLSFTQALSSSRGETSVSELHHTSNLDPSVPRNSTSTYGSQDISLERYSRVSVCFCGSVADVIPFEELLYGISVVSVLCEALANKVSRYLHKYNRRLLGQFDFVMPIWALTS